MRSIARPLFVLVLALAAVFGYRWWNSPERQINRALDGIAESLSHDRPADGLAAVAAAAGMQQYFTVDAAVEPGGSFSPLVGRDAILSAVATVHAATPSLQVELVDRQIAVDREQSVATVNCTASAKTRDRAGQESLDARQLVITLRLVEGHWLVARVTAVHVLEPVT